jgi:hypothetical protein
VTAIHDAYETRLARHRRDNAFGMRDTARRSTAEFAVADASANRRHSFAAQRACAVQHACAERTGTRFWSWRSDDG